MHISLVSWSFSYGKHYITYFCKKFAHKVARNGFFFFFLGVCVEWGWWYQKMLTKYDSMILLKYADSPLTSFEWAVILVQFYLHNEKYLLLKYIITLCHL